MPPRLRTRIQTELQPRNSSALERRLRQVVSRPRQREVLFELPDFMFALALTLQNGLSLYAAIDWLSRRMSGRLGEQLRRVIGECELGAEFQTELALVSERLPEPQLEELVTKLLAASTRGTPVSQLVTMQAESIRAEIAQLMLRRAGQNETKMLIPTVFLILPTTVLFAVFPSVQLLFAGVI